MNKKIKYLDYVKKEKSISYNELSEHMKRLNIAILRSFTIETIQPILKVESFDENIFTNIFFGEYNQYYQEIIDRNSRFYKFNPDICILAIRLEELYPALLIDFLGVKDNLEEVKNYILNQYINMIEYIKNNCKCNILINNFILPCDNYTSLYDFQDIQGQVNFIRMLNLELVKIANDYTGVYIVDLEYASSKIGKFNIIDNKMWYLAKNPYKYNFYIIMAKEYIKYIKSIYGLKKKGIILDLDNTLWGGIVGEDGIDGIKLGDSYPGICYKDFQRELLKLKKRGIILAICSKNNIEDVKEVFKNHPDMVLKEKDFACIKANWNDKSANIKAISEELNIGMDSLIFIDDNPVECELISQMLPEVKVINLPKNPIEYSQIVNDLNDFESINLTSEDLDKTDIYKAQVERNKLKNSVNNLEQYYESLEMKVEIKEADSFSVSRISQLTQKTNQFNLTTKRYTEEDIKEMLKNDQYKIYYIRVMDKFGDNGITGCCILNKIDNKSVYIDTFLLSCRVMGRNIENSFMCFIHNILNENGFSKVIGEYIPTKKNKPVKDFYRSMGFDKIDDTKYTLSIKDKREYPKYIQIL